jgi:6-phosphogluconate dehydrogenase
MSDASVSDTVGTAQIGVTGLAVMGSNIARNFARHGYTVALHNRSIARTDGLLADHGSEGKFVRTETMAEFAAALERPRRALIMVKAGDPTDAVINELAEVFEEGDIIIDGGNALYTDTIRREKAMAERGLHFVGAGISGGEEGALNGPSIMPGGPAKSYESLGPLLEEISAHVDGTPCCTHIGPDGAGHFVKMVHNGIEYSDMQLIGEAYQLLRDGLGMTASQIADVFTEWNKGDLDSFLVEITAEVLRQVDAKTGKPLVDVIVDEAEQKGTGRSQVSPRPCSPARCRGRSHNGRPRPGWRRVTSAKAPATQTSSPKTSAKRYTRRRSSPTHRGSTRSRRAAPNTTGASPPATWPPSGAAAASSAPSSSTGSKRPTTPTPTWPR